MNLHPIIIIVTAFFCQSCCANSTADASSPDRQLRRGKRYLDFIPKSRMFFRANVKDNVIKVNTLWAHAFGFRANYPIENDKKYRPFRRDVVETVEELLNRHGLDGQACSLKAFCEAVHMIPSESKMVFKLFKLVFTTIPTATTADSKNMIRDAIREAMLIGKPFHVN